MKNISPTSVERKNKYQEHIFHTLNHKNRENLHRETGATEQLGLIQRLG